MVVDELITSLKELEEELPPYQVENKSIVMTHEQEAEFQAATHCYMCDGPFTAESNETGSTSESSLNFIRLLRVLITPSVTSESTGR